MHLVSAEKVPSQSTQLMCSPLRKHRNQCMRNTFLSSSCISLLVNYCQSTHFSFQLEHPLMRIYQKMLSPVKLYEKQYKSIKLYSEWPPGCQIGLQYIIIHEYKQNHDQLSIRSRKLCRGDKLRNVQNNARCKNGLYLSTNAK